MEQEAIDRLQHEAEWLLACTWKIDVGLTLEVHFDLKVHGKFYSLKLTYPDLFPDTPAYIRPRDSAELLSGHQYGPGGSLCLEWRADNWNRSVTGADLIKSAYALLEAETNPERQQEVPSAHIPTRGQELRGSERRIVFTQRLLEVLSALPPGSVRKCRYSSIYHLSTAVIFISEVENEDGEMIKFNDIPLGISLGYPLIAFTQEGSIFKSSGFNSAIPPSSPSDLKSLLNLNGFGGSAFVDEFLGGDATNRLVLIVPDEEKDCSAGLLWRGEEVVLHKYKGILPDQSSQRRLPNEAGRLASLRFGIVGMGSIGSKVAISLARSGARRFLLVDDDYMTVENILRHELSWAAVGLHKVDGVNEALRLIASDLEIEVLSRRLAGQESALLAAATLKNLGKCDVLIDATANARVFLLLASVAKTEKRPLCWGEVFAGGIGGIICRARPDLDPNPLAMRTGLQSHLLSLPEALFRQSEGYDAEAEEPLIAYDSDVSVIAASLTKLVIDTALQENIFPASLYMIGLRRAWDFSQPFDVRPIMVEGEGWESDTQVRQEEKDEVVRLLSDIISRQFDVEPGSSQ